MSKKSFILAGLALALVSVGVFSLDAEAARRSSRAKASKFSLTGAPNYNKFHFGAGITSASEISARFGINDTHSIQGDLRITGATNQNMTLSIGALYRAVVWGRTASGFHVGGGTNLGSNNGVFQAAFRGVAGFGFSPDSLKNLLFTVDAGPTLVIQDGGNLTFAMGSVSNILVASAHYIF